MKFNAFSSFFAVVALTAFSQAVAAPACCSAAEKTVTTQFNSLQSSCNDLSSTQQGLLSLNLNIALFASLPPIITTCKGYFEEVTVQVKACVDGLASVEADVDVSVTATMQTVLATASTSISAIVVAIVRVKGLLSIFLSIDVFVNLCASLIAAFVDLKAALVIVADLDVKATLVAHCDTIIAALNDCSSKLQS